MKADLGMAAQRIPAASLQWNPFPAVSQSGFYGAGPQMAADCREPFSWFESLSDFLRFQGLVGGERGIRTLEEPIKPLLP